MFYMESGEHPASFLLLETSFIIAFFSRSTFRSQSYGWSKFTKFYTQMSFSSLDLYWELGEYNDLLQSMILL